MELIKKSGRVLLDDFRRKQMSNVRMEPQRERRTSRKVHRRKTSRWTRELRSGGGPSEGGYECPYYTDGTGSGAAPTRFDF